MVKLFMMPICLNMTTRPVDSLQRRTANLVLSNENLQRHKTGSVDKHSSKTANLHQPLLRLEQTHISRRSKITNKELFLCFALASS